MPLSKKPNQTLKWLKYILVLNVIWDNNYFMLISAENNATNVVKWHVVKSTNQLQRNTLNMLMNTQIFVMLCLTTEESYRAKLE